MGQGSISQPGYQQAQIGAVLQALQAAHMYYGIDTEKAQQKLLGEKIKAEQTANAAAVESNDPNSVTSKSAALLAPAALEGYERAGVPVQNKSQLIKMIQGAPAKEAVPNVYTQRLAEHGGIPGNPNAPDQVPAVEATPGMTANQIKQFVGEESPLAKLAASNLAAKAASSRLSLRDEQFDRREENKENKEARLAFNKDQELVTAQNRLNGLVRIQDIIHKVETGKLKDTNQIKNSIANEYSRLETGSNTSGLGQAQRADMINTLRGDANDLITRVTGKIKNGSISPDQLKQLKGEIGTMGESYQQQFDQRHQALRQGFNYPSSIEIMDQKANSMRDSLSKRMGGWGEASKASGGGGDDIVSKAQAELARRRAGTNK